MAQMGRPGSSEVVIREPFWCDFGINFEWKMYVFDACEKLLWLLLLSVSVVIAVPLLVLFLSLLLLLPLLLLMWLLPGCCSCCRC